MTGPQADEDADEAELRATLARGTPKATPAHDAAILAAADRASADIRARRARRWIIPTTIAASLVLVSLGSVSWFRTFSQHDSLRGSPAGIAMTPADGARLDAAPAVFAWQAVAGASSYEVTLRDSQGAVLSVFNSATPVADLPRLPAARFDPGTYFWTVRARGPALDAQLGPFSFQIRESR
jgi:hypothetical protein